MPQSDTTMEALFEEEHARAERLAAERDYLAERVEALEAQQSALLATPANPTPAALAALDGFHFTEPRRCVECESCGFAFDAMHSDDPDGGYTCPVCELAAARQGEEAERVEEELSDEMNAHLDTQRALVLLANQLEQHSIPFVPEAEAAAYKARRDVAEFDRLLSRGMDAAREAFEKARAARAASQPEEVSRG